jgi:integrase
MEPGTGRNPAKTFKRMQDARDYAANLRRDLMSDEYRIPVQIGYEDWVKQHLEDLTDSPDIDLAPKTIAGHREALMALERVCKPKSPLDISPKMIRQFRRAQLENGLAPRTINKHISAIRSALSYAMRAEIIPSNRLLGPHRLFVPEERKPVRIVEVGEVTMLMKTAVDLRHKSAISLAYYHGLRRREICNLRWEDVDLRRQRLDVVDRPEGHTKTRIGRSIALRKETAELLVQLCVQRINAHVFEKPGTFYWSFDKWLPRLLRRAGLDHFTLHDLRKTCNTLMKENGVPEEAAMQILGHATTTVNQRYYTGTLIEQQRKAIDSLPSVG